MVLFSQMLGVFLTALFICLMVQVFAYNFLSLMRQGLAAFRSSVYGVGA